MSGWGAAAVVVAEGRILLTKRQDFDVWCLPGGAVEEGECVADAATREAREETGLDIALTRLIGIYYRPTTGSARDGHVVAFAARPIGGELRPQVGEATDARFFDLDALPTPLMWWNRQVIADARAAVGGSAVWYQDAVWPFGPEVRSRQALYERRDRSGLAPAEFYARYLMGIGPAGERRLV